jgi:hypothetical protein
VCRLLRLTPGQYLACKAAIARQGLRGPPVTPGGPGLKKVGAPPPQPPRPAPPRGGNEECASCAPMARVRGAATLRGLRAELPRCTALGVWGVWGVGRQADVRKLLAIGGPKANKLCDFMGQAGWIQREAPKKSSKKQGQIGFTVGSGQVRVSQSLGDRRVGSGLRTED